MGVRIQVEDGNIIEVPDGMTPDQAEADYLRQGRLAKIKASDPGEYDPESDEYKLKYAPSEYIKTPVNRRGPTLTPEGKLASTDAEVTAAKKRDAGLTRTMIAPTVENQRAAIGSGLLRGWKGATNLVLPDSLTPNWASDTEIEEMDKRDEDLPMSGKMIGGIAATAPFSAGVGAAQKGATALSTLSKAPVWFTKALASAPVRAALEGATQGAIYAPPKEQAQGAAVGAGLGVGLNRMGALGGRIVRGLVKRSEAAKELEQLAGQHNKKIFLPLAQAASDEDLVSRTAQTVYREALPIVPGTTGVLRGQADRAKNDLREISIRESAPDGTVLPANPGHNVDESIAAIRKAIDAGYDETIKQYSFNVPSTLMQDLMNGIRGYAVKTAKTPAARLAAQQSTYPPEILNKMAPEIEELFKVYAGGKNVIDGSNLLAIKRELTRLMQKAESHAQKTAYLAADDLIDDLVTRELSQGGSPQNLADLQRYLDLTPAYRSFVPLAKAAEEAVDKEGRFAFNRLAKAAGRSEEQKDIGQLGAKTVDQPVTATSKAGQALANTGAGWGAAAAGAKFAPLTTATVVGGGTVLARPTTQKLLMGTTSPQERLAELLRQYPNAVRRTGSAARTGVIKEFED